MMVRNSTYFGPNSIIESSRKTRALSLSPLNGGHAAHPTFGSIPVQSTVVPLAGRIYLCPLPSASISAAVSAIELLNHTLTVRNAICSSRVRLHIGMSSSLTAKSSKDKAVFSLAKEYSFFLKRAEKAYISFCLIFFDEPLSARLISHPQKDASRCTCTQNIICIDACTTSLEICLFCYLPLVHEVGSLGCQKHTTSISFYLFLN
jgi:hypothetical protein